MNLTTINLKAAIYNLISSVAERVYERGQVPDQAAFPYAVYQLGNSVEGLTDSNSIQYPLEIDVIDHSPTKDTAAAENLADSVDGALNRINHIGSVFYFRSERVSRNSNYPTPDEFTIRRNLRYNLLVYDKE